MPWSLSSRGGLVPGPPNPWAFNSLTVCLCSGNLESVDSIKPRSPSIFDLWVSESAGARTCAYRALTVCFPTDFKTFKKNIRDNFYLFGRKGYPDVEKSKRTVIQASCDLVLTCFDSEHTSRYLCLTSRYKKWTPGTGKNHGASSNPTPGSIWKCVWWPRGNIRGCSCKVWSPPLPPLPLIWPKSQERIHMKVLCERKYKEKWLPSTYGQINNGTQCDQKRQNWCFDKRIINSSPQ